MPARPVSLLRRRALPPPCSSTAGGERLQRGGAQYLVKTAYRSAGVGGRVPKGALVHALRHTTATRLAEDGASASEIQHLLGHESLSTAQLYMALHS